MIESISSNRISSQPRTHEISGITIEITEIEMNTTAQYNEDSYERIHFPKEKVKEIVEGMNKFMEASPTALKFEFHEKLNEYYVKIVDEKTKETVREIPPKKMLDYYAAMTEFIGLMVDKKI